MVTARSDAGAGNQGGGLVLVAAFAAQAWAASRGHSLGGLGPIAFAALGAVAFAWARR